ncbi:hypothetical protein CAEBREN_24970 [Caenorhabditis brenneri]|uniref:Uncharacterized protein n=1 Tax=Caenorhabditis brenneri TaxID=135651 RepID=G0MG30_CAEBE|nr:hypothetical protein CAEBREN_24970 [Caenorhabditis brenneri]
MQSQMNSFQEPTGNDFMKQIISQNQETQRMILSLQSQLNSFQNPTGRNVMNMKEKMEEENESESKKTKAMAEEVLKEAQSQSIINDKSETEETHVPPIIPTFKITFYDISLYFPKNVLKEVTQRRQVPIDLADGHQ